jgi:hypothetical protein
MTTMPGIKAAFIATLITANSLSVWAAGGPIGPITYEQIPIDMQVFPRDLKTNKAKVDISGVVTEKGYTEIILTVLTEGSEKNTQSQKLTYNDKGAPFSCSYTLNAALKNSDFIVSLKKESKLTEITSIQDVVAGDIFIINGQSNAEAHIFKGSANGNQGPFVRSFGSRMHNKNVVNDLKWHKADGDMNQGSGAVGQWGMRLGRLLSDNHKIPIAILNGALGGRPIGHYKRNDQDHYDLNTNYGRLLYRCREAGVLNGVRGIFWYQGESDQGKGEAHENGFVQLYKNWKEDIPSLERTYVNQLRTGCGVQKWNVDLRDRQRRLPDQYKDISIMATTGIDSHDGCHYAFVNGYEILGNRLAALVGRDLYQGKNTPNIEAPNIAKAYFSNTEKSELTIETRNETDQLVWDEGAEKDFKLEGSTAVFTKGSAKGNKIILTLNAPASTGTGITYSGHAKAGPWVKNGTGIGLLTFANISLK